MEQRLARALVWLGRGERAVVCVAFLLLIGLLFGDVLSREITGTGFAWTRQLGVYANLVLTMGGLGLASAADGHLRPRFADRWLPTAWEPVLLRLQEMLMGVFCAGFAVMGVMAVGETAALQERTATPSWQVWPFQAVIPLVFLLAAVRHLLYAGWPRLKVTTRGAAGSD